MAKNEGLPNDSLTYTAKVLTGMLVFVTVASFAGAGYLFSQEPTRPLGTISSREKMGLRSLHAYNIPGNDKLECPLQHQFSAITFLSWMKMVRIPPKSGTILCKREGEWELTVQQSGHLRLELHGTKPTHSFYMSEKPIMRYSRSEWKQIGFTVSSAAECKFISNGSFMDGILVSPRQTLVKYYPKTKAEHNPNPLVVYGAVQTVEISVLGKVISEEDLKRSYSAEGPESVPSYKGQVARYAVIYPDSFADVSPSDPKVCTSKNGSVIVTKIGEI
ncbi:hypothetical protein [Sicyoidochytrium minutum DNA virus]|nr:hypothetical protein [Sicyoidochytrium minutum DNA virus]